MNRVNVAALKASLSRYLRMVKKGEHLVIMDRKQPIAELVPLPTLGSAWERLAREGKCRLGSQDWASFRPIKLKRSIPIEEVLRGVQEDAL